MPRGVIKSIDLGQRKKNFTKLTMLASCKTFIILVKGGAGNRNDVDEYQIKLSPYLFNDAAGRGRDAYISL